MSSKSSGNKKPSRSKKRTQPRKGAQPTRGVPTTGAGTAVGATPATGSQADPRPPVETARPLPAFRTPTVTPPSGGFRPPRTSAPAGAAQGTSAAPGPRGPVAPSRSAAPVGPPPAQRPASSTPTSLRYPPGADRPAPGSPRPAPAATTAVTSLPVGSQTGPDRVPFLVADMPDGPVQVMSWNCSQVDGVEPQGLGMTYWFDAAPDGDPYPVSVRFTGRRISGDGPAAAKQTFETVRTVERVIPGSGRVAMTTRVPAVAPGTWKVTATPVILRRADGSSSATPRGQLSQGSATGTTAFLPVVNIRAPGVRIYAWPGLVGAGFLVALLVQGLLGAQRGLPAGRLLLVSVLASAVGLIGAKAYYLLTHRAEQAPVLRAGMSVQGFVLAAIPALVLVGRWAGIPLGPMLDISAPALLFGMTIGRLGCFFGGCCVGLPTASRWGIWSSDRGIGVRRIPVQLFESALAGTVGSATLLAVALLGPAVDGLLFVIGLAAYTFGRQMLFPLRGIPRTTAHGRVAMMALTGLVVAGSVLLLVLV